MLEKSEVTILDTRGRECESLSLEHIAIRGRIKGFLGRFTLQHAFKNEGKKPLELIYTFPLSSTSLIEGFLVRIGGNTLKSQVKEREEAQELYDGAVLDGDSAFLLSQHRSNIFTLNIGNLGPQEELVIQLSLSEILQVTGNRIRVFFPTVIGPRYIPGIPTGERSGFGWADPTDQVPDADWITPPVSKEGVPYRVSMDLEIPDLVLEIESPSHPINVKQSKRGMSVGFALNERANRDIVLYLGLEERSGSRVFLSCKEEKGVGLLNLQAEERQFPREERGPMEFIFLLDRSGSMAGEKMDSSKRALRLCLRKLDEGDRFHMVAFNHEQRVFRKDWTDYGKESFREADKWVDLINAGGGTELYPALKKALSLPLSSSHHRAIVILTDGQVGNEEEIRDLFDDYPGKVLLFGIDTAVNQELFEGILASATGSVEYIYPGEDLEEKVSTNVQRLFHPAIEELKMESGTLRVRKMFPRLPALFRLDGGNNFLFEFDGEVGHDVDISLRLSVGETLKERALPEFLDSKEDSRTLEKLWARELIKELEKGARDWQPKARREALKKRIVDLALRYELQTRYTNWVAVYVREAKIEGLPKIQVIPQELPLGWQYEKVFAQPSLYSRIPSMRPPFRMAREFLGYPQRERSPHLDPLATFLRQDWDGSIGDSSLKKVPKVIQTAISLLAALFCAKERGDALYPVIEHLKKSFRFLHRELKVEYPEGLLSLLALLKLCELIHPGLEGDKDFKALKQATEDLLPEEVVAKGDEIFNLFKAAYEREKKDLFPLTHQGLERLERKLLQAAKRGVRKYLSS